VDIADLNLSVRAFNAVCRAGLKTIPELYHKYQLEPEWLHREIGQKHMHEVGDALALHREEVWEELRKEDEDFREPMAGDYLSDYDRDLWGDAVTFDELAQMVGQLVIVNDSWYPEDELELDGEGDVLLVTDADGDVVHLRGDTPKIYEITRQAMDDHVHCRFCTKVWRIRSENKEDKEDDTTMNADNGNTISIENLHFTSMRTDLNAMLQKTIASMLEKNSAEAVVTLKINIGLFRSSDGSDIIKPAISHKVTSAITSKESIDGYVSGDYALDFDEEQERYTMRELPPEGGQMTLI
jgi:hypothetical protein